MICAVVASVPFAEATNISSQDDSTIYESVTEAMKDKSIASTLLESNRVEKEIERNLNTFVDDLNDSDYLEDAAIKSSDGAETDEKQSLNATSVEYSNPVYIIEKEIYGVYLDFNDDNGYAVVGSNRTIYEVKTQGDLEEIREYQDLLYSIVDGFVYFDEHGVCQKLICDTQSEITYQEANEEVESSDTDYYAAIPNLGDYTCYENIDLLSEFECYRQRQTSYYLKVPCDKNGNEVSGSYKSEGNCSPTAMYHVIKSWTQSGRVSGINSFKTTDVSETIKSDSQYKTYITKRKIYSNSKDDGYHYWIENYTDKLEVMPALYVNIRNVASSKGFTPEKGFSVSKVDNVLEEVVESYGTTIKASSTSSISEALSSINKGRAVYMSVNGASLYNGESHGVALLGYRIFIYTTTSGAYDAEKNEYNYFVADGHDDEIVTINPTNCGNPTLKFVVME
ncbi:MAG: hypothetical protein LUC31_01625 [Coprobacillus sp.]|nr:hypothetical protein [Coprobacillus sp.]